MTELEYGMHNAENDSGSQVIVVNYKQELWNIASSRASKEKHKDTHLKGAVFGTKKMEISKPSYYMDILGWKSKSWQLRWRLYIVSIFLFLVPTMNTQTNVEHVSAF